jgi:7-cyano-7-deazaguanine synthase
MNNTEISKAVILLSGGIDSATCLAISKAEGHELYAISFDYNQRHIRELESAKILAKAFAVREHLIIRFNLTGIGGSALTTAYPIPKKGRHLQSAGDRQQEQSRIPVTYVPARNTIFLSFALAWAEVIEAQTIFIGANSIDYSGYPDCRPEYLLSFEHMANLATKASVEGKMKFRIKAPLISMTKAQIIKTGSELGVDYALTWSCYDPQPARGFKIKGKGQDKTNKQKHTAESILSAVKPCGHCDSCLLRAKGFSETGRKDPLYVNVPAQP